MKLPTYTISNDSVTVVCNGVPHTVREGASNYTSLRSAVLWAAQVTENNSPREEVITEAWAEVEKHLTPKLSIETWAKGLFSVQGEAVFYNGKALPSELNSRIFAMAGAGESPEPLFRFWERLQKNPSYRSVNSLWPFLRHAGIPLTEDGCILAYKGVNRDYTSKYGVDSDKIDYHPGNKPKMPRNEVSDDPETPCHAGIHVGSLSYAKEYASSDGRVIICKVAPENVVCVPKDKSWQKMRTCEVEVVGHYGDQLPSTTILGSDIPQARVDFIEGPEPGDDDYDSYHRNYGELPLTGEDDEEENETVFEDIPTNDNQKQLRFDRVREAADRAFQPPTAPNVIPYPKSAPAVPESIAPPEFLDEMIQEGKRKNPEFGHLVEKATAKREKSRKAKHRFDRMDLAKLLEQPIQELRDYATHTLQIVGASKIRGGRPALVNTILELRRQG